MRAFIFPGQGSQKVGMGAELAAASAAAREVFEEVDDALGQKLFAVMRDGPEDQLMLTENAQPAIMANAIATLRVLARDFGVQLLDKGDCVAGHSLGEYTALCGSRGLFAQPTLRGCSSCAGRRCRRRCRWARARWRAARRRHRQGQRSGRRCRGGRGLRGRQRQRSRPGRAFRAARTRSSAPWRWPRISASSAACCCRFRRRSTAR